jgi:hypothetical protein
MRRSSLKVARHDVGVGAAFDTTDVQVRVADASTLEVICW